MMVQNEMYKPVCKKFKIREVTLERKLNAEKNNLSDV